MKNSKLMLGLLGLVTVGIFAYRAIANGSIKGTVAPAEGAVRAWAESPTDTLKAPVVKGAYEITGIRPGVYKLIIEAKPPYRNTARDGILVSDGQMMDAGMIRLEK